MSFDAMASSQTKQNPETERRKNFSFETFWMIIILKVFKFYS